MDSGLTFLAAYTWSKSIDDASSWFSLGFTEPFLHRLVVSVCELMGTAFPELIEAQDFVEQTIKQEELRFAETLDQGLRHLEDILVNLEGKIIARDDVFKLYDTYGFPQDLTADIARERGLTLDKQGFDKAMAEQRKRARAASKFTLDTGDAESQIAFATEFVGYEKLEETSRIIAIFKEGRSVKQLTQGEQGGIVLETTPFYAESGGQVGDRGKLMGEGIVFEVSDTQKQGKAHIHLGEIKQGRYVSEIPVTRKSTERDDRYTVLVEPLRLTGFQAAFVNTRVVLSPTLKACIWIAIRGKVPLNSEITLRKRLVISSAMMTAQWSYCG